MSESQSPPPEPGDRPPAGASSGTRLERPPSDRYRAAERGGAGAGAAARKVSAARPIAAAAAVAVLGAAALTLILGVLLSTTGTFVVSLLGGAAIGLLLAGATVGRPTPALDRARASRIAIAIALAMVVLAGIATWLLARSEGGVMDPVGYLWTTFGFGIPAQAIVAVLAAAWGAASGPIRWRD